MTTTRFTCAFMACLVAACGGGATTGSSAPAAGAAEAAPAAGAAPAATPAVAVGQPVLARFRSGPFWFAGRVEAVGTGTIAVAYLDGAHEELPAASVRPFDWGVGSRVECNWKRKGAFYPGRIVAVNGQSGAQIAYDDGDREVIDIAFCRAR